VHNVPAMVAAVRRHCAPTVVVVDRHGIENGLRGDDGTVIAVPRAAAEEVHRTKSRAVESSHSDQWPGVALGNRRNEDAAVVVVVPHQRAMRNRGGADDAGAETVRPHDGGVVNAQAEA
jgi:hypothetical protein